MKFSFFLLNLWIEQCVGFLLMVVFVIFDVFLGLCGYVSWGGNKPLICIHLEPLKPVKSMNLCYFKDFHPYFKDP